MGGGGGRDAFLTAELIKDLRRGEGWGRGGENMSGRVFLTKAVILFGYSCDTANLVCVLLAQRRRRGGQRVRRPTPFWSTFIPTFDPFTDLYFPSWPPVEQPCSIKYQKNLSRSPEKKHI